MSELENMLMSLARVGRPTLRQLESECWQCRLEFPAPEGVQAEVNSDFDHANPVEAMKKVLERLEGLRKITALPADSGG